MGAARLLAKGWVLFCVFGAGHALVGLSQGGALTLSAAGGIAVATFLFGAMGLLFVGGYGASSGLSRLRPTHWAPGFNELVFIAFVISIFVVQTFMAPGHGPGGALGAAEAAIRFAVPGQRALEEAMHTCGLDGARAFTSAFAWVVAFVYLGSALSHIRLSAALVRLERKTRPEILGDNGLAFATGFAAIAGIQLLFVGSLYQHVPCGALTGVLGAVLIGIGPLALCYLIIAAVTNLLALGPEG